MYILARSVKLVVAALMVALFVGCGGGDGGNSNEYKTINDLEYTKISGTMHFNYNGENATYIMRFANRYTQEGYLIDEEALERGLSSKVCTTLESGRYRYLCVEILNSSGVLVGYGMNISSNGDVSGAFAISLSGDGGEAGRRLGSGDVDGTISGTIVHLNKSIKRAPEFDGYDSSYYSIAKEQIDELKSSFKASSKK